MIWNNIPLAAVRVLSLEVLIKVNIMRRAQSTIEYILVIGALAASLIIMGAYMKRGFQGNVRGLSDQIGEQYEPGRMSINNIETVTVIDSETTESTSSDGSLASQDSDSEQRQTISRSIQERIDDLR